jgi:hypothetical protein
MDKKSPLQIAEDFLMQRIFYFKNTLFLEYPIL